MIDNSERQNVVKSKWADETKIIKSPHVLVAEDDFAMRKLLASVMVNEGYNVTECSDGSRLYEIMVENIRNSRQDKINIIISDFRMPGLTGLEFLAMIREIHQNIPVIIITAFGDDETHELAHRLGAWAIFDKPFDIDDLIRSVRKAVDTQIKND